MTVPKLSYKNKIILAPMVRVGTLPMRLLALENGADIVYTEELIDFKLVKCKRCRNSALNTVDFVDPSDGTIVFRTCAQETARVVLQMGTCDAQRALAVGKLVQNDVAGIDINMGCPKEFSIKGGMGVALLSQPEKAAHILRVLCENLDVPVTCKIRILPDINDTIELVKRLAATGISAIAIHARTRDERPQHSPHPDFIRKLAAEVNIPIIANGGSKEIQTYGDIFKFKELCNADSVMIARAAQGNVSIFRKEGVLPIDEIIQKYLKLSIDYDNAPHNTKYCVQSILKEMQETARGKQFLQCQTLQQICEIWDLGDYCYTKQREINDKGNFGRHVIEPGCVPVVGCSSSPKRKKMRFTEGVDVIENNIAFLRSNYREDRDLPKSVLYRHSCVTEKGTPKYQTEGFEKLFRAVCIFDGKTYSSTFWEKNKKQAEQGAALVCLLNIGIIKKEELMKNGSILR